MTSAPCTFDLRYNGSPGKYMPQEIDTRSDFPISQGSESPPARGLGRPGPQSRTRLCAGILSQTRTGPPVAHKFPRDSGQVSCNSFEERAAATARPRAPARTHERVAPPGKGAPPSFIVPPSPVRVFLPNRPGRSGQCTCPCSLNQVQHRHRPGRRVTLTASAPVRASQLCSSSSGSSSATQA